VTHGFGLRVTVEYPVDGAVPGLLTRAGMNEVVRRADELGYDAVAFTDHPAPTQAWLETRAGHETLDVITSLAFCAAVTERIRLMTYLLVVPYRNPFAAAKALATVDRLSDGRLTVVTGAGYLVDEFKALGVDFASRNERFDEALEVMRAAWTGEPVDHAGPQFPARGVVQRPGPVQVGGIPVLVGGNSSRARDRASRHQGWSPLIVEDDVAASVRTRGLTMEGLPRAVREVRAAVDGVAPFFVQVQTPHAYVLRRGLDPAAHREHLVGLREAGVDSFVLKLPTSGVEDAIRGLEDYVAAYR
jgi:probable F420-dependent oxidoreductase